jgi:ribose 1,5-bisphosphokinase
MHWQAHGLRYGIPSEIEQFLRAGRCVVCNASRTVMPSARARHVNAATVLIDAPPPLRAQRLALGGRESARDIGARFARVVSGADALEPDLSICNDGPLAHAGEALTRWLRARVEPLAATMSPT